MSIYSWVELILGTAALTMAVVTIVGVLRGRMRPIQRYENIAFGLSFMFFAVSCGFSAYHGHHDDSLVPHVSKTLFAAFLMLSFALKNAPKANA